MWYIIYTRSINSVKINMTDVKPDISTIDYNRSELNINYVDAMTEISLIQEMQNLNNAIIEDSKETCMVYHDEWETGLN